MLPEHSIACVNKIPSRPRLTTLSVAVAVTQLTACNPMHEFFHRPVNVDKIDVRSSESMAKRPAATVAVDATRRFAVFNRAAYVFTTDTKLNGQQAIAAEKDFRGDVHPVIVCAEPPPDTAVSTLNQAAADLKATVEGFTDAKKAELETNLQTLRVAAQKVLANRTEIVELYRTAMFALCFMHMNGSIKADDAKQIFSDVTNKAFDKARGHFAPGMNESDTEFPTLDSKKSAPPADDQNDAGSATDAVKEEPKEPPPVEDNEAGGKDTAENPPKG